MNSTSRTKEFINDRDLQMQPLHLRTQLQVRDRAQGLQLRPDVRVRPKLRQLKLTATRRSVLPLLPSSTLATACRQVERFAAMRAVERIIMPIFIWIPRIDQALKLFRLSPQRKVAQNLSPDFDFPGFRR